MAGINGLFPTGNGEGWIHLKRFAGRNTGYNARDVPEESLEFMVELAIALCREGIQLEKEDASRKERNRRLTSVAMENLKILRPSKGRTALEDMTRTELENTAQWRCAMEIWDVLWANPCMAEHDAIKIVAKLRGTDEETREIRRAWKNMKPYMRIQDAALNPLREYRCAEIQIRKIRPELYDLIQQGHITNHTAFKLKPPFPLIDCELQPPKATIKERDSLPKLLARILVNDEGEADTLKGVKGWSPPRRAKFAKQIVEHLKKGG